MTPPRMEQRQAISLSISIINAYCRKDLSWIPQYLDDRTLFIGPREGQFLNGGTDLFNAWMPNHPLPDFSVSNIDASSVLTGPTTCEVVLHYDVTWHKPDGDDLTHPQVMQISWFLQPRRTHSGPDHRDANTTAAGESRTARYKVAAMHISNPQALDERDLVYNTFGDIGTSTIASSGAASSKAVSSETASPMSDSLPPSDLPITSEIDHRKAKPKKTWIMINGVGATLSRYPSDSIIWIESASKGKKSTVHTRDQDIHCVNRVGYFMENYPGIFLQPSVSYIVNPLYVKQVSRFQAELWNGRILRIPEKKYTGFKKDFEDFFERQ